MTWTVVFILVWKEIQWEKDIAKATGLPLDNKKGYWDKNYMLVNKMAFRLTTIHKFYEQVIVSDLLIYKHGHDNLSNGVNGNKKYYIISPI